MTIKVFLEKLLSRSRALDAGREGLSERAGGAESPGAASGLGRAQNNLADALSTLGHQLMGKERLQRRLDSVAAFREITRWQPNDQSRFKTSLFELLVQWDPVNSGRFHRHGFDSAVFEPLH